MRLALVLLCLAAPANAVTFHLVGAQIDQCTSNVSLPGFPPVPDPTPCVGKVGMSLDGKIRVVMSEIGGKLRDRWLLLQPDELPNLDGYGNPMPLAPDQTYITNAALKVNLGFEWGGISDHYAGLHFNRRGNIDKWYLGSVLGNGAYTRATTSWGTGAGELDWSGLGPAGTWYRHRTMVAGPVPKVSPVPLPATAGFLLAALALTAALRRRWSRCSSTIPA